VTLGGAVREGFVWTQFLVVDEDEGRKTRSRKKWLQEVVERLMAKRVLGREVRRA
jgi:hypothetical protein